MGLLDSFIGFGSVMLSFITFLFIWWYRVDNYADPIFRLTSWVSKLAFPFSPYIRLTISEHGAELFQRSEFFLAVEAYLSKVCASRARKLKADIGRDKLLVNIDDHEEVIDTYGGATVWWYASKKVPRYNFISFHPAKETRFYQVVFHRRHRDLIINEYLPYVFDEGSDASIKNRPRRLFTNKPSTKWNPGNATWSHVAFQHPATFDTLAMEPKQKRAILDDLKAFQDAKDYYKKVGKAWKRGYLLYGPPGTGKSTMIAAMANYLDYDVYDLELTAVKNNTELRKLFIDTKSRSIIVIEDIDCSVELTGKRKDKKSDGKDKDNDPSSCLPISPEKDEGTKMTLSGLLNFIDGLWSACGDERIIIFTTNNKDKLDPALLRRGRMDMQIEMSYCSFEAFRVLAKNYLDVEEHRLFGDIERLLRETYVAPADVAENLMLTSSKNEGNPDTCLEHLVEALKVAHEEARKADKALADAEANKTGATAAPKDEGRAVEEVKDKTSDSKMEERASTDHRNTTMVSPSIQEVDSNEWILDTSAWIHHTSNPRLLRNMTTAHVQKVAKSQSPVLGRGAVETKRFKVPDVRYIEGDARNIISVAQLARSHALVVIFEPTCCYVKDKKTDNIVGVGFLRNGVYVLDYLLIGEDKGRGDSGGKGRQEKRQQGRGTGGRNGDGGSDEADGGLAGGGGGDGAGGGEKDKDGKDEKEDSEDKGQDGTQEEEEEEEEEEKEEEEEEEDIAEEQQELPPEQRRLFGLPQSDSVGAVVPTAAVFMTPTQHWSDFIMDSGACHHITYFALDGGFLKAYPTSLNITPPEQQINGIDGVSLEVCGIGYFEGPDDALDYVLYVPRSAANAVSVSQLASDYSVRVLFDAQLFSIVRLGSWEMVGQGKRKGKIYVLDHFRAGRLVAT